MGMAKICKDCACYEVCFHSNPHRTEDCNLWEPIIVRCKDCKHLDMSGDDERGDCEIHDEWFTRTMDDFCSYGQRRECEDGKEYNCTRSKGAV